MRKKQEKSKEEKAAENYFEVDESDLRYATQKDIKENLPKENILKNITQKEVKEISKDVVESIEKGSVHKNYKKPKKKQIEKVEEFTVLKKKFKKSKKAKEYSPPKISLRSSGYELIITEKPQAALKIASALGNATQRNFNKIPYYEVERGKNKIVVACAVGHLFTLKQKNGGYQIPVFDISWIPNFLARKKDFTKRYYDTILKLAKESSKITVATDYDIEGEVIGLNIIRYICNQKDASRMKFSTLTKTELEKSYENKVNHLDWGQAIAGETRHYLDWFYGINLSRALMNSIKTTGKFKIMSIGRVQGPALNLIVKKDKEIESFQSKPYWQIFLTISNKKDKLELKHNKEIFNKSELKNFENLKGKKTVAETIKKQEALPPPVPFNLTTLQTEAYKFYGLNPSKTLQIAQSLYLAGLISYPRTSSQKLPDSIDYKTILKNLAREFKVEELIRRNKPIEGPKTDSAHPSIYPTGNKQILSGEEDKIYKLIIKRFLSLFCEDALIDHKTVKTNVNGFIFSKSGQSIYKKSWLEIYPSKLKEEKIPDMEGEVEITNSRTEQKETQPPKRYSPASIISELEKRNLGTKATRSSILETLYDRGYVEGQSIQATPLGISLINTLEKYSPIIIDEKLTKELEEEMEKIQDLNGKLKQDKREKEIIEKAKITITKIANDFEKSKNKIGQELVDANTKYREQQKRDNALIKCPKCRKGDLAINYSKKTKRFFVSCNAYPECKTTYSLPPNGQIKKADKLCEECGYPMLTRISKGKRPWTFCWNSQCPTNKKRIEEYKRENE
ncbi:MAG: DNA topoisomerase I [Candidatus Diapherotrites archaeon]